MPTALELTRRLVAFDSVSCRSNVPVTDFAQQLLDDLGFATERVEYDDEQGVRKASVIGKAGEGDGPGLAYFGHTDVVPADDWARPSDPFEATVDGARVYGRGCCDMKGSVACMLAAASRVGTSQLRHPLFITCTADEEVGYLGAAAVVERSELWQQMLHRQCRGIIGEPTGLQVVHAHKGTCGLRAIARGRAAHSSTRHGRNANLAMIPFLSELKAIHDEVESDTAWHHPEFDPPTLTWNIGINDHTHAVNVTAAQSVCTVYFRPMPGQEERVGELVDRARRAADQQGLEFRVERSGPPLYVDPQSDFIQELLKLADRDVSRTVCYGTDGGVFRELQNLAVLGPGDIAQAHTVDEFITVSQLDAGVDLYERLIRRWCCP